MKRWADKIRAARLGLAEYWGLMVLVSLFYYREYHGVDLNDCKIYFLAAATFVSLAVYGMRPVRWMLKAPVVVILLVTFFKIYNASSLNAIHQWVMISLGGLLFLQVAGHVDRQGARLLKTYLGVSCMALSMSVLVSGLPNADIAAPYTVRFSQTPWGSVDLWSTFGRMLPGALGNQGFSAMFIALTIPFTLTNAVGLVLGMTALGAIAWMGTVTPLLAVLAALVLAGAIAHGRRALAALAGLSSLMVGGLALFTDFSRQLQEDGGRFGLWRLTLGSLARAPLLGYGPGVFRDSMKHAPVAYRPAPNKVWDFLCNEYLTGAFIFGGVGMLAAMVILGQAWKGRHGRGPWALSALILGMLCVTWFPFHIASTSFVAILVLAILSNDGGSPCLST